MKPFILILGIAGLLFTACKKNDTNKPNPPATGTILLKKIITTSPSDPFKGRPAAEFNYNGTTLHQATIYNYGLYVDEETHTFSYDNQKHLTGSVISHTGPVSNPSVRSVISYTGNDVSNIKLYSKEDYLNADINITYQNGNIAEWSDGNKFKTDYDYDTNGNSYKEVFTDYRNLTPGGIKASYDYQGFDTKIGVNTAIPF